MELDKNSIINFRGAINVDKVVPLIKNGNYNFLKEQKLGFNISYQNKKFGFHAVDRFASIPLFYLVHNEVPIVSEDIDLLLPHLSNRILNPEGYFCTGGLEKGMERSEFTPFEGVKRIPAGHYLLSKNGKYTLKKYWSFENLSEKQFLGSYEEAAFRINELIIQSIKRTHAFFPNAALHLSGGLDSGIIASQLCQLSAKKRSAYVWLWENAPESGDRFESQFLSKYEKHYPQLEINRNYSLSFKKKIQAPKLINGANNWFYAHKDSEDLAICQSMKSANQKVALTGLGGDELATYGFGYQNVSYELKNDFQLKLFTKYKIKKLNHWRAMLSSLRRGNLDRFRSNRLSKLFLDWGGEGQWYTQEFRKQIFEYLETPLISSNLLPLSYDYRLMYLDRSFFTVRSDLWNFIGREYDVTFIHPLLDSDLVDFCATLPRHFFQNRVTRELIKTAMKDSMPAELLQSGKRPIYIDRELTINDVQSVVHLSMERIKSYHTTFAASVYGYNKMEKLLWKFEKQLKTISENHQQTLFQLRVLASTILRLTQKGDYLNRYFG